MLVNGLIKISFFETLNIKENMFHNIRTKSLPKQISKYFQFYEANIFLQIKAFATIYLLVFWNKRRKPIQIVDLPIRNVSGPNCSIVWNSLFHLKQNLNRRYVYSGNRIGSILKLKLQRHVNHNFHIIWICVILNKKYRRHCKI